MATAAATIGGNGGALVVVAGRVVGAHADGEGLAMPEEVSVYICILLSIHPIIRKIINFSFNLYLLIFFFHTIISKRMSRLW